MRDPVTGYEYPMQWVEACTNADDLVLVKSGFGVLLSTGKVLRRGLTTGTTAAAACKAAVLSLRSPLSAVSVSLPCGLTAVIPVHAEGGVATATKDPGDYPEDATAGLEFIARADAVGEEGFSLIVGAGIGRFSRDTPRFAKGDAAISPTALWTIEHAVMEALDESGAGGVQVALEVPHGEAVARRTLNPKVGVMGGISVLGSTGLVEPWDDHLSESAFERIKAADRVVLTTGRLGLRYSRMHFPDLEVVLIGKYIQKGIDHARGEVILCGLPALILRFIDPGILDGTGYMTVEELSAAPSFSGIMEKTFQAYKQRMPHVRVVIVGRNGAVLGDSG